MRVGAGIVEGRVIVLDDQEPVGGTDGVTLWLRIGFREPLSGSIGVDGDADPTEFSGWIELMSIISALKAQGVSGI
jgi:hypothetical protein